MKSDTPGRVNTPTGDSRAILSRKSFVKNRLVGRIRQMKFPDSVFGKNALYTSAKDIQDTWRLEIPQ